MLGRKTFTAAEIAAGRAAVTEGLAALRRVQAVAGDGAAAAAVAELEPVLCADLVLVMDRHSVHRIRPVTGKDTNPLNEVELLAAALLRPEPVLAAVSPIKYVPERAVLGLAVGAPIRLTADDVDALATAFFAELETRFTEPG